jgi:hypothetical protein
MAFPRSFLNLTTLPDGQVLATGGETDKNGDNISNAVYAAELWSPQTKTWTTMASMHTPREYHGTALLLPDGRVLVSGMGADFGQVPDQRNAEFYSPPYLFKGPRPTITQAPGQISYGANFAVTTPDAAGITSAALIRTGAVTHFFDENTRFVPLAFQQAQGGLTLTAPASANVALRGYYMLSLVNSNGVPVVSVCSAWPIVHLVVYPTGRLAWAIRPFPQLTCPTRTPGLATAVLVRNLRKVCVNPPRGVPKLRLFDSESGATLDLPYDEFVVPGQECRGIALRVRCGELSGSEHLSTAVSPQPSIATARQFTLIA